MELNKAEEILVNDVLDYMLDFHRYGEKSKVFDEVTDDKLNDFGKTYCETLNSVYKDLKPYEPIKTNSFVCYPFYFKEKPEVEVELDPNTIEEYLDKLIRKTNKNANLRITRVMRVYDKNTIFLIKPKHLRYWLRSVAIRDADNTFADLIEQGY